MRKILLGLALCAAAPFAASAAELSYTNIEAGYARAEILDESGDGFYAKGSAAFGNNFYGFASYQDVTHDDSGFDVSLDETVVGLGFHTTMTSNSDFIAEIAYLNVGTDIEDFGSGDSDGYRAALGVRGMMADRFEGNFKLYYSELDELDGGELGTQLGAVLHLNDTWGVAASWDHTKLLDENINSIHVGVRASF